MHADAHDRGRPQDLYNAREALSGALGAVTPGAVDGPKWVDRSPVGLSPRLVAVIQPAPQSLEHTRWRKLFKMCRRLATYNNAPSFQEGDKDLRDTGKHLRDFLRLLAACCWGRQRWIVTLSWVPPPS